MLYRTPTQAFEILYDTIVKMGEDYRDTKALFNTNFTIQRPMMNVITTPFRDWKLSYATREWRWYKSGNRSVEELKKYAPIWDKMHNGNDLVWSNYGFWWKENDQYEKMLQQIRDDIHTRRAVLVHYDVYKIDEFGKDTPCNLVLNFYVKDGRLYLTVMARSIDLWYGFCNDQFCFSNLLLEASISLDIPYGHTTYFITNLHLYNEQIKKTQAG